MHSESIERQVALASYGTAFLRGELALEDWYRHGVFFGARLQFRALLDNALLADDFTLWLGILQKAGALRLSLHLPASLGVTLPRARRGGELLLAAHYADRHALWLAGEEWAAWSEHPLLPGEPGLRFPAFPDATSWGGELDSYWCVEERPGALEVPDTDWKQLTAAIAADLAMTIPSSLAPAGPVIPAMAEPVAWATMPLFPSSKVAYPAHRLLAALYREQARFDNDTNPKNENSSYKNLGAEDADKADAWGERLESWIIEVQLRCANEYRASDRGGNTPLARIHTPAPVPVPVELSAGIAQPVAPPAQPPPKGGPAAETLSGGKWVKRLVFVIALAAASLFVLAIAHIVTAFPWLVVLISLPCALYINYKKR